MMEPSPASTFAMVETDLLFQILKVAFDAPAQLGGIDKLGRVGRQRREPEFGWRLLGFGPFDESRSRCPDNQRSLRAIHVSKTKLANAAPKSCVVSIARIGKDDALGDASGDDLPNSTQAPLRHRATPC